MKKNLIILFFLVATVKPPLLAQSDEDDEEKYEMFKYSAEFSLGGYIFNKDIFFEFIPGVSYYPFYWFNVGAGYYYQYRQFNYENLIDDINVQGIRGFLRFHPISQGCFVIEYRYMTYRTNIFNAPTYEYENVHCHAMIAGLGFTQSASNRFYFHTLILFDFLNTYKTPYSNPIFQTTIEYRFNLSAKKRKTG